MKVGDLIKFKKTGVVGMISEIHPIAPGQIGVGHDFAWVVCNDPRDLFPVNKGKMFRSSFLMETLKRTAEVISESR